MEAVAQQHAGRLQEDDGANVARNKSCALQVMTAAKLAAEEEEEADKHSLPYKKLQDLQFFVPQQQSRYRQT